MHVLLRWPQFDARRASARTFLDRILRQRQREIVRQRNSKSRRAITVALRDVAEDYRKAPSRDHVVASDCRHDISRVLAGMSFEKRHLALGLTRHTVTQLARLQRRHRQRLHETIRLIRQRFLDADLQEYLP